jgi:ATP-dependent Clp protease adapter protein ClpS
MRLLLCAVCALGLAAPGEGMRMARPSSVAQARGIGRVAPRGVARSSVFMESPGGPERQQEKRRSRLATIDRVKPDIETERKEQVDKEPIWRVLLHNDDVHTFDYVSMSIVKVVKTVSRKKAFKITVEAHMSGIATVTTTWKAQAKSYCTGLQKYGLTSSIAPDPSMTA